MSRDELAERIKFVLRDRDSKFTAVFDEVFRSLDAEVLLAPILAPRANAIMEHWIGSCRRECLDNILVYNARHAERVLTEYVNHYVRHEASLDRVEVKGLHLWAVAAA